jgi:site-specific recombinase XerD
MMRCSFRVFENNRLKKLSQSDVAKMIKWTASSFNLDPKHFSTHSMRIGSATALLAAGHEDKVIKELGN